MIEEVQVGLDCLVNEVINFFIVGQSEVGKFFIGQVCDVIVKIDKIESFYFFSIVFVVVFKFGIYEVYEEICEFVIFWYNVNEMINMELLILKRWVGNEVFDFYKLGGGNGLGDDILFMDCFLKEEGFKLFYEDNGVDGKNFRRRSMLDGIL